MVTTWQPCDFQRFAVFLLSITLRAKIANNPIHYDLVLNRSRKIFKNVEFLESASSTIAL